MPRRIIDRGIFLQPSGVWWAWSMVTKDRANSLHTKDQGKAQAKYDRRLRKLKHSVETEPTTRKAETPKGENDDA